LVDMSGHDGEFKTGIRISEGFEISPGMRDVLRHVFINMPWSHIGKYIDPAIKIGMNLEIGFGADELEGVSAGAVSAVVGRMRENGCRLTIHGPFWDLCSGSIDHRIREVTRSRYGSLLDLAQEIRPERIVCHTGFDPRHHRGHRREWIENCVSTWKPVVERAEAMKTLVVLENVWEADPSLHLEIFEQIKSPWIGFCLDTGHQHSFSKTPLNEWLDATWQHLGELHIHDNDGVYDSHLPVGSGSVDFDYLFNFLAKKGISPVLTLEPHTVQHMTGSLAGLAAMSSFKNYLETRVNGGLEVNGG